MPREIAPGPLVTIITPSYNQGQFIRATVESVLSQDYPHIEYIIMDGGSTDNTAAVVAEYAGRLSWVSEKDRGQSHAINKGFQRAQGEIVAWINSDDTLLPGAVRRAVDALVTHPEYGAVYGEGYTIDYNGAVKGRFPFSEPFNLWKLVYHTDYILQQSVYFRRAVVAEVGWLDESLHFGLDWDLLVRIGKRYPLGYIPELMGCLREYDTAKSFSGGEKRFRELAALVRRQAGTRFPPGYIIYGLDTYDKIWSAKLARWTPGVVPQKLIMLCRAIIDRTMRDSQGLYRDGWAGPVLHYMLPPGSGRLRIKGQTPGWWRNQTLTLHCDGQRVAAWKLTAGEFAREVQVPAGSCVTLRLESSRWKRPRPDTRRLAWQVHEIAWA